MQNSESKNDMFVGIIGGSGLYALEGLENVKEVCMDTPYGKTSSGFIMGNLAGVRVCFLARHGKNHELLPAEVPYRANIYALKKLGVRHIIAVGAVGSLQAEIQPCDMVIVDQYMDFTKKRESTFFGGGLVGHVSMASPTCEKIGAILYDSASSVLKNTQNRMHYGGTYICIEGPQFSSKAESTFYQSLGAHVIGMTNMPEARLAREAQMAYAALSIVTDYDCWYTAQGATTMEMMLANFKRSTENAKEILKEAICVLAKENPISLAHTALEASVYTDASALTPEKKELLAILKA